MAKNKDKNKEEEQAQGVDPAALQAQAFLAGQISQMQAANSNMDNSDEYSPVQEASAITHENMLARSKAMGSRRSYKDGSLYRKQYDFDGDRQARMLTRGNGGE